MLALWRLKTAVCGAKESHVDLGERAVHGLVVSCSKVLAVTSRLCRRDFVRGSRRGTEASNSAPTSTFAGSNEPQRALFCGAPDDDGVFD